MKNLTDVCGSDRLSPGGPEEDVEVRLRVRGVEVVAIVKSEV